MKVRVINGSDIFWVEGDFTTYGEFKNILVNTHGMNLERQSISMRQLFGDTKPVFRAKKEGTATAEDRVAPTYVLPTNLGKKADTGEITHDFTVVIAEVENKLGAYSPNTIKELRSKMRNLMNQAREAGVNQPLVNSTEHLMETVVNELMAEQVGATTVNAGTQVHHNIAERINAPIISQQEPEDFEEEDEYDEYNEESDIFLNDNSDDEEDESFEEKDDEVDESFE